LKAQTSGDDTVKLDHSDFIDVIRKTPLIAIDLIIRNKHNEVLIGLRNNEPAKGYWFVPGGRILLNERIAAAFGRIAQEELGVSLSIEDASFVGIFEHFYQNSYTQEPGLGTHYIVLAYEIKISNPLNTLPRDQHHQFKWITVSSLLRGKSVHPNTKAFFA
jgi:colanic acid biosynthesis protein WcaH